MDYDQLREVLVNTEQLYNLFQSSNLDESEFIKRNASFIEQAEKDRLAREMAKARQKRFQERQQADGRRTLTAIVSAETYDLLCQERDRRTLAGEKTNFGLILDDLLSVGDNAESEDKETDNDEILRIMLKARNDGLTWGFIADQLNERGYKTARGKVWTKVNCQAYYSRNK